MKKLTRVKLINWHRFTNTLIEFDKSTLISGENGAGKSTLLDAIQFVVMCSASHFNKAAHENGKRKLTGYIRCKTGKENKPYERTGELSAHIALEFYEESRDRYFIVGAVVDSSTEGQEKTIRYLVDNRKLEEEMFLDGRVPRSITNFRAANDRIIRQWCTTEKDARSMIKNRFGRIEDKFFRLIPKALAFRPIDDIKDFVYSYVLDNKEVNIDTLRENVRSYQDLQNTLENVKLRIERLEQIETEYSNIREGLKKDARYDYFLARAEEDITSEALNRQKDEIKSDNIRLKELNASRNEVKNEQADRQIIRDNLFKELASDNDFIAKNDQEKECRRLEAELEELQEDKKEVEKSIGQALRQAKELLKVSDVKKCVGDYFDLLSNLGDDSDISVIKEKLEELIAYKGEMSKKLETKRGQENAKKIELINAIKDTQGQISNLKKKKLSYPTDVERVLEAIKDEFVRIGRKPSPRILCELLEIEDDEWRNAVEGYLNTQRFYILVEPQNFDIALGTYDRLRREKKAYGVGLINTQKLDKYNEAPEGSLAEVVSSGNKYAKQYINMILGKVVRCDSYQELKQYPTSITRECMRYQNHVASAIKPAIFETPYIGRNALIVQLAQAKDRLKDLEGKLNEVDGRLKNIDKVMEPLSTEYDTDIKYRIDVLSHIRRLRSKIKNCKDSIAELKQNENILQKEMQLSTLENTLTDLQNKISNLSEQIGRTEDRIQNGEHNVVFLEADLHSKKLICEEYYDAAGEEGVLWQEKYENLVRTRAITDFRDSYSRSKKANLTVIDKAEVAMRDYMSQYKTAHNFGAAATREGYPEFEAELVKLKSSELLKYESKVESARSAAEEEFREQFLAKLQENIKTAISEFKDLNKALKDIAFSNEKYKFLHLPSKKYRAYYEMIMDDFNAMQGESIFSGVFHETHRAVIDELFERLALDQENTAKALDEFTDYRTYMDYDIRIIHSDGSYSLYSKVCEEKSGGETQTPFYVTVAASFVQLYKGGIGNESVGLVMFDEAFNNMDDERIGGVLEFLNKLPLQILIAAPPDKIQYISPSVRETLLVMTDEKNSFVEKYGNGAI